MPNAVAANRRRLTDDELLRSEFRFDNPELIVGLCRDVPDPNAHPVIIGYYDVRPPGGRKQNPDTPFVRCSHCGLRRHWNGRVVRDDLDKLYIIGARSCGREHYGTKYEAAEVAFKAEQERQTALLRWRAMIPLVDLYLADVAVVLASMEVRRLEGARDAIRTGWRQGYDKLVRAITSTEPLVEYKDVRDLEAEENRQSKYERAMRNFRLLPLEEQRERKLDGLKPEQDSSPIFRRVSEDLGVVMGGHFLLAEDIRSAALALRGTLHAIKDAIALGTDQVPTTRLSSLLKAMAEQPAVLTQRLADAAFAPLFFQAENLSRLERWTAGGGASYFRRGETGCLIVGSMRGEQQVPPITEIALPEGLAIAHASYRDEDFSLTRA